MSFKLKTYLGDFEWNAGDSKPLVAEQSVLVDSFKEPQTVQSPLINDVISITASGDELLEIATKFKWIPSTTNGDSTIWRGAWATFIYENL